MPMPARMPLRKTTAIESRLAEALLSRRADVLILSVRAAHPTGEIR